MAKLKENISITTFSNYYKWYLYTVAAGQLVLPAPTQDFITKAGNKGGQASQKQVNNAVKWYKQLFNDFTAEKQLSIPTPTHTPRSKTATSVSQTLASSPLGKLNINRSHSPLPLCQDRKLALLTNNLAPEASQQKNNTENNKEQNKQSEKEQDEHNKKSEEESEKEDKEKSEEENEKEKIYT
ncbi:uncharacterized protein BO87DRAFT_392169 [Aspergillus neoniger CBS 115656]|uniref:Uncharacterized protein n=1 Tax=Aspergillus neoniger (strain CBS 115656) TaxID=1448310 RepID=A0A318Y5L1_ASPNB|nr:hypothetical protein BO87DRAFT_392169 [Aspergillus neoniger CBS 115656]PYH28110.1 hypothetical protein BO87DRAFT_392169 [Aspergillus neoniger CBS 115656]